MNEKAYYEDVNLKNELKLREMLKKMPAFCKQFFIGIEPRTSSRTRLAYAYDLDTFFDYLKQNNPLLKTVDVTSLPLSILNQIPFLLKIL